MKLQLGTVLLAAAAIAATAHAQTQRKDRPITSTWECDNGRTVLFNAHPRRPREEAWVTYLGNRVEVHLKRGADGARFASKDGKVTWQTSGAQATLEFAGLLDQPLSCRRKAADKAKK
ncbi:MAG TPA: MliC family protein [Burkholderiaceae bacterium]|nr:MliC family protein [Burkholderiaceae bacterium]